MIPLPAQIVGEREPSFLNCGHVNSFLPLALRSCFSCQFHGSHRSKARAFSIVALIAPAPRVSHALPTWDCNVVNGITGALVLARTSARQ